MTFDADRVNAAQLARTRAEQARARAVEIAQRLDELRLPSPSPTHHASINPAAALAHQESALERSAQARDRARTAIIHDALAHDQAAEMHQARGQPDQAEHHRAQARAARARLC